MLIFFGLLDSFSLSCYFSLLRISSWYCVTILVVVVAYKLICLACHLEISPKTTKHSTLLVKPQSIPLWKFKLHISQLTSFLEKFLSKKFIKFVGRTILQKEKKKFAKSQGQDSNLCPLAHNCTDTTPTPNTNCPRVFFSFNHAHFIYKVV